LNSTDSGIGYELSETFPVSRERLFDALTDATTLKKIWGVQEITVDARVGGKSKAVFVAEGQDWSFTITYTDIVRNQALRWMTHFNAFPTKETRVTATLGEVEQGTELVLRMENFETVDERDANRQAWQAALATLGDILAERVGQRV
jgi:uncharacterized protein YndB with AHSA1/START domain